jgi:hypothetical protein
MLSEQEDRNGVDAVNLTSRVVVLSDLDRTIGIDKGQHRLRSTGRADMLVDEEKILAARPHWRRGAFGPSSGGFVDQRCVTIIELR